MRLLNDRVRQELEWIERQIREETHRPVPDLVRLQGFRRRRADAIRRLAALRTPEPLTA